MAEANKQREFNYLLMKLFLHAFIHGMCAVFSLWRTLEASWHATLDFSSFCMVSSLSALTALLVFFPASNSLALVFPWAALFLR